MVVIQVKRGDTDGFLFETSCTCSNDALIREMVDVWNLRVRLRQLAGSIRELGMYGPMKEPDKVGLDEISEKYTQATIDKGPHYTPDPTGIRVGNGVGPQLTETFEMVARDAEAVLDKNLVSRKVAVTKEMLMEKMDNIRGAVTMAYPMGLPAWDAIRLTIESNAGLEGTAAATEILDPDTAELWVATKVFDRSQTVGQRLGMNEKTKVIAKLQGPGSGAPCREPGVSEEEKSAMMAFYFKKQEEMKALAEANDDDYLSSSWADPKQLQKSLRGVGSIKAPGLL